MEVHGNSDTSGAKHDIVTILYTKDIETLNVILDMSTRGNINLPEH